MTAPPGYSIGDSLERQHRNSHNGIRREALKSASQPGKLQNRCGDFPGSDINDFAVKAAYADDERRIDRPKINEASLE